MCLVLAGLQGGVGYPWFHSTYVAALEPVSSYPSPLAKAIEAGAQLTLGPGDQKETSMVAVAFAGQAEVTGVDARTGMVF
ncbi:MAG: hypothetical protein ACE15E_19650 [Acidobacteriota bacterium]